MLRQFTDKRFFAFLGLTFCAGSSFAMVLPVLSLYLVKTVGAGSGQLGMFYTVSAVAGIVVTQILAKFSDGRIPRRLLMIAGFVSGALMALVYMIFPVYSVVITAGVLLSCLSAVAGPQVFALGREYSLRRYGESVMFTSYMRAMFSLSWVVAPPLTYALFVSAGPNGSFTGAAAIFAAGAVTAFLLMPKGAARPAGEEKGPGSLRLILGNPSVVLAFAAFTLLWASNTAYLAAMPIFVTDELALDRRLPGFMMGTAAFLEIPALLLGSVAAKKTGLKFAVVVSAAAGVAFYACLSLTHPGVVSLLLLQFLNAVFIGILAGLGMVYMQELLPSIPGQATTLYNNSVNTGNILSGIVVAETMGSGSAAGVFHCGAALTALALVMIFFVRKVRI